MTNPFEPTAAQRHLYDMKLVEKDDILFMRYTDGIGVLDLNESKWRTCVVKRVLQGKLVIASISLDGTEQKGSFVVDMNQDPNLDPSKTRRYTERMLFKDTGEPLKRKHLLEDQEKEWHEYPIPEALRSAIDKHCSSSPEPRINIEGGGRTRNQHKEDMIEINNLRYEVSELVKKTETHNHLLNAWGIGSVIFMIAVSIAMLSGYYR